METLALAPVAVGGRCFHTDVGPMVTAIVKVTYALSPSGLAQVIEPLPLTADVHYESNVARSVYAPSDFAPRKRAADVVFCGHACVPHGQPSRSLTARLTLEGRDGVLIDKSILVMGDRRRNAITGRIEPSQPFSRMPLRWELAFGGAASRTNPIGVGVANDDVRQPNLLHPGDPRDTISFGPLPPQFWTRARALGGFAPSGLEARVPYLPSSLDPAFFNVAPEDQRVRPLHGDERVGLFHVHPQFPELRVILPGLRAHAMLDVDGARPQLFPLVADTLWIDGDTLRACVVFRGELNVGVDVVEGQRHARIVATLTQAHEAPSWGAALRPATVPPPSLRGGAPSPESALQPTAPSPAPLPPPWLAPIAPVAKPRFIDPPAEAPTPRSIEPAARVAEPRFIEPPAPDVDPPPATASTQFPLPERESDRVPVFRRGPLPVCAFAFQLAPPQYVQVVVVKSTWAIVTGELRLLDEQPTFSFDVTQDEDEGASLRYASDFAPWKPKCDVTLVGHAYAGSDRRVGMVRLSLGSLDRRLAVFGDRRFGALGVSDPAPFERMPLRWERAFGGALSADNPVGIGFQTQLLAPNLEDPNKLVTDSNAGVTPACTAPVSSAWRSRARHVGTYGRNWLKTRWPWLPEDFDFAHFNAAPEAQQIAWPRGDERFSIRGALPGDEVLEGTLPRTRPRVFAQRTRAAGGSLHEVPLHIDTLAFDADARTLTIVHRGLAMVSGPDAADVALFFLTVESPEQGSGEPFTLEQVREQIHAELLQRKLVTGADLAAANAANSAAGPDQSDDEEMPTMLRAIAAIGSEPVPVPPPPLRAPTIDRETLIARLRAGRLAGADLSGVDGSELDFRELDLRETVWKGALLASARFDGAKLHGATFADVDATRASFVAAGLERADFTGAQLARADLSRAELERATFADARAMDAVFEGAHGARVIFAGAVLEGARFSGSALPGAVFSETRFDRADFTSCDLTGARFFGARAAGARMDGAKLADANFENAVLAGLSARSIEAPRSSWQRAQLEGAIFEGAILDLAGFSRASLRGAVLTLARAKEARFRGADLREAKLLKADLMRATFERARLAGADLRGANLYQAETWQADLEGAQLDLAFTAGTKL